jgi:hypothetical protein
MSPYTLNIQCISPHSSKYSQLEEIHGIESKGSISPLAPHAPDYHACPRTSANLKDFFSAHRQFSLYLRYVCFLENNF